MTQDREALRRGLIERREALPDGWRRDADASIVEALDARLKALAAGCIGVFLAHRAEPDLRVLYDRLRGRGIELALPRVAGRGLPLAFGCWRADGALVPEVFGIEVPSPFEPVLPDALIVPCVGFDRRGFRLGYGGGYYDRTLAGRPVPAFGAAYACCEIEAFEAQPYDRPLLAVCTEAGCVGAAGAQG